MPVWLGLSQANTNMQKNKPLNRLEYEKEFYERVLPKAFPKAKMVVRSHIQKLSDQIDSILCANKEERE
jgi:hypothetical protein